MEISLDKNQSPRAQVFRDGKVIIKDLSFGLALVGGDALGKGLEINNTRTKEINQRYPVVVGKSRKSKNHCRNCSSFWQKPAD